MSAFSSSEFLCPVIGQIQNLFFYNLVLKVGKLVNIQPNVRGVKKMETEEPPSVEATKMPGRVHSFM